MTLEPHVRVPRHLITATVALLALVACDPDQTVQTLGADQQAVAAEQPAVPALTPAQVAWLEGVAQAQRDAEAFLESVAAVRAAVPDELHRIMWCEAGSYLNLPQWATNYQAMTHGYDGASGGGQALGSTWLAWAREVGVDTVRWPRAFLAPEWVQDLVLTHGYVTRGTSPWTASRYCWAHGT